MDTQHFSVDTLKVSLYPDALLLAQEAAKLAQVYLQTLLQRQETATVMLATGNSQLQLLKYLISENQIDWQRVTFFHLDEYLGLDTNDPRSFRSYLEKNIIQYLTPKQFYYWQTNALEPIAECRRYAKLLEQHPLDLCFLGVGINGHLAFNEPSVANFEDAETVKIVKLDEATRLTQVDQGHFSTLQEVPRYAYTVTLSTLKKVKYALCVATGRAKAPIIKTMLTSAINPTCPASLLRLHGNAHFLIDQPASLKMMKIL